MSLRAEAEAILHDRSKVIDAERGQLRRFASAYMELLQDGLILDFIGAGDCTGVWEGDGGGWICDLMSGPMTHGDDPREAILAAMTDRS